MPCARLGTPYEEPKAIPVPAAPAPLIVKPRLPRLVPSRPADTRAPREVRELDLAENYAEIIQKARRKQGLSQEDLAMRVKERLSMIQKIELGKMVPNMRLARTLEHVLRVKLLVMVAEPPAPKLAASAARETTLADIAKIRKKEEEKGEDEAES
jgi:putative transcription factor